MKRKKYEDDYRDFDEDDNDDWLRWWCQLIVLGDLFPTQSTCLTVTLLKPGGFYHFKQLQITATDLPPKIRQKVYSPSKYLHFPIAMMTPVKGTQFWRIIGSNIKQRRNNVQRGQKTQERGEQERLRKVTKEAKCKRGGRQGVLSDQFLFVVSLLPP